MTTIHLGTLALRCLEVSVVSSGQLCCAHPQTTCVSSRFISDTVLELEEAELTVVELHLLVPSVFSKPSLMRHSTT